LTHDHANLSLHEFLHRLGERTPTPGGGAVAALVGALSAALSRMVAEYAIARASNPSAPKNASSSPASIAALKDLSARLHRADQLFRALLSQDIEAYGRLSAAGKAVKSANASAPAGSEASREYQQVVLSATAIPMEMAAVAANVLSALDELKETAARSLLSDVGAAAVTAEAAARAARYIVLINVDSISNEAARSKIRDEIQRIVSHGGELLGRIEHYVGSTLQQSPSAGR